MKDSQLLLDSRHGIFLPRTFVEMYENLIDNKEDLKEEIEICSQDPNEVEDSDDYWMCWDTILSEATIDNNVLVQDGDLWLMSPEEAANWEYI